MFLTLAFAGMWIALHRVAASLPALLPALGDQSGVQLRFVFPRPNHDLAPHSQHHGSLTVDRPPCPAMPLVHHRYKLLR